MRDAKDIIEGLEIELASTGPKTSTLDLHVQYIAW